jgi:hypothetical protein
MHSSIGVQIVQSMQEWVKHYDNLLVSDLCSLFVLFAEIPIRWMFHHQERPFLKRGLASTSSGR